MKENLFNTLLTSTFLKFDRFSKPLSFHFKRKPNCVSLIGGCTTLAFLLLFMTYCIILFQRLYSKVDISIDRNVVRTSLSEEQQGATITEDDNIEFKIVLSDSLNSTTYTPAQFEEIITVNVFHTDGTQIPAVNTILDMKE